MQLRLGKSLERRGARRATGVGPAGSSAGQACPKRRVLQVGGGSVGALDGNVRWRGRGLGHGDLYLEYAVPVLGLNAARVDLLR